LKNPPVAFSVQEDVENQEPTSSSTANKVTSWKLYTL